MAKNSWIDQLQQLLGGKSVVKSAPQLLHEPLQRSERFMQELSLYALHQEGQHRGLLAQHYFSSKQLPGSVPTFVLLQSDHASGFLWYAEADVPEKHYDFLMERLAAQLQEVGYSEKQNERKIWPSGGAVQELHKRYLKPRIQADEVAQGRMNQRYGNVLLEVLRRNDRLQYLKLQCNIYSDGQYLPAQPFDELMHILLD
jgi:hypothetical protein